MCPSHFMKKNIKTVKFINIYVRREAFLYTHFPSNKIKIKTIIIRFRTLCENVQMCCFCPIYRRISPISGATEKERIFICGIAPERQGDPLPLDLPLYIIYAWANKSCKNVNIGTQTIIITMMMIWGLREALITVSVTLFWTCISQILFILTDDYQLYGLRYLPDVRQI